MTCWQRDIFSLKGDDILDGIGLDKGDLDLLDGSPPCQGFSMAGKRRVMDGRNDLSMEFARLIEETMPKVFLMENVPGMVRGKMKGRYAEVVARMGSKYNIASAILDAS